LAFTSGNGLTYIAKGNKTSEFYSYTTWERYFDTLAPIPAGPSGRLPHTGCRGAGDGHRFVYMAKGNMTNEFWRYDVVTDSWRQLKDVFSGPNGKKVKAGSDLVNVTRNGEDYLYLLKGHRCEFCRFNVAADSWESLPDAPAGAKGKWPDGSWLVYDLTGTIYAHKAKYREFYSFNVAKDSWNTAALKPMPIVGPGGKKKSGTGACGAWHEGKLYALKGNNSQELWGYVPARDSWFTMDTMPSQGLTGKKSKVKAGADMVSYEGGNIPVILFVLKGNKTLEFWLYEAYMPGTEQSNPEVSAMASEQVITSGVACSVRPNPVSGRRFLVSMAPGSTGRTRLRIYDALGRCRQSALVEGGSEAELDAGQLGLNPGVYLVRMDADGHSATAKFTVTR
jgi:hypothetical protein